MLRWFPRLQVATASFSCSPPDFNFLDPYFIFMYMHYNHCHRATAHLQLYYYYYYYYNNADAAATAAATATNSVFSPYWLELTSHVYILLMITCLPNMLQCEMYPDRSFYTCGTQRGASSSGKHSYGSALTSVWQRGDGHSMQTSAGEQKDCNALQGKLWS